MDILRLHKLTVYLIVGASIFSLALAERAASLLIGSLLAMVIGWHFVEKKGTFALGRRLSTVLTLAFSAYAATDLLFISGSFVYSIAHYIVLVQFVKLFGVKTYRDYLQLYATSLFLVAVASVMTTNIGFSALFLFYAVMAVFSLSLLQIKKGCEECSSGDFPSGKQASAAKSRLGRAFFFYQSIVAFALLALSAAFFLVLPRMSMGFLIRHPISTLALSGFADEVGLTDIGIIKSSSAVVMRIEPPPGARQDGIVKLWRGVAYDEYTGSGWRSNDRAKVWVRSDPLGNIPLSAGFASRTRSSPRYTFSTEELSSRVVFVPYFTAGIGGSARALAIDYNGSIFSSVPLYAGSRYAAFTLAQNEYSPLYQKYFRLSRGQIERLYLGLPPLSSRFHELARSITAGVKDPYLKALKIESYLRNNYSYSLDLRGKIDGDPVEHFLFRRRSGHCEYFASAMALLLRSAGVPARYINGFSGGEWNEFGGYYLIRQKDAHSWVEAHIEGRGWIAFDPTPAVEEAEGSVFFLPFRFIPRYFDSLRVRWNSYVIDFSLRNQITMVQNIKQGLEQLTLGAVNGLKSAMRSLTSMPRKISLIPKISAFPKTAFLAGIGLACFALIWLRARPSMLKLFGVLRPGRRLRSAAWFYSEALSILARRGLLKAESSTPREFARMVSSGHHGCRAILPLTEIYYMARFGSKTLDKGAHSEVAMLLESLRRAKEWPAEDLK